MGQFVDNGSVLSLIQKASSDGIRISRPIIIMRTSILSADVDFTTRFIHRILLTFLHPHGDVFFPSISFSSRDSFCIYITKPVSLEYHLRLSFFLDHAGPWNLPLAEHPPDR